MRVLVSMLAVASAVVWVSCAVPSGEAPRGSSPDLAGPTGLAAQPLAAQPDDAVLGCANEPPPLLTPRDGAVVSGPVVISAPLLEGPCAITATVVFEVVNSAGTVVLVRCDNDLPAHTTWDTTSVKNGVYTIRAHRACACNACALFSSITVTVANPA
jgi:hypothetical protein